MVHLPEPCSSRLGGTRRGMALFRILSVRMEKPGHSFYFLRSAVERQTGEINSPLQTALTRASTAIANWRGKLAATNLARGLLALCMLLPCGGAAGSDRPDTWIQVRSPHFVVASDVGEKRARRIAQQFEQLRRVFHSSFPSFRADPGQPILIVAVKDEEAMKEWLPQYWEEKGHLHPSGLYAGQEDKHFVLLRMDSTEENPYHTICHEYAHALLYLNFRSLPLWLNEGLSEFFGNCTIGDKEVRVGEADRDHLRRLKESKLLPVEELLRIDKSSAYYNEKERASLFYAEAWAFVHYLMVDPLARKEQLLL